MRLLWAEVRDFRNHEETRVEPSAQMTVLVGPNAQGKTNLLEAIHYLLHLATPRTSSDEPLVRQGASSAFLRGEVETLEGRILIEVEVRASGANRVQVNRSPVRRKRDLRKQVRSVLFLPEDLAIVSGGPEQRRAFLDDATHALRPTRETARRAYDKALRQRNRLLKEHEGHGPPPALDAWDEELIRHGAAVTLGRAEAVERVGPRAGEAYADVSGHKLLVRYDPSVDGEDLEATFRDRLRARRADELARRSSLVGPHRDELELAVEGKTARRFASHGETWAAALCLRLGLAEALERDAGEPPVLLLDDPFSGVDPERRRRLAARLGHETQTFLGLPDEAQVPPGADVWEVAGGRIR